MRINPIFGEPKGAAPARGTPSAAPATRQSLSTGLFGARLLADEPADRTKRPEQLPKAFS